MPEPGAEPEAEGEGGDIIITGTRISPSIPYNWEADFAYLSSYVPFGLADPFAQSGGGEAPVVATFEMIDGNVVVKLPGYDFVLKVPEADWARMTVEQRGEFIKMMTEFRDSPMFIETLNNAVAEGLKELIVRFDTVVHAPDGSTSAWVAGDYGQIAVREDVYSDGSVKISQVIININSLTVPGSDGQYNLWTNTQGETVPITLALVLAHELRHTFYPGGGTEAQVRPDADQMMDQIFSTPGSTERTIQEYISGQTYIGSMYDDVATGTSASDTLSGLSGNDILDGGAGDDLVMGGVGMDRLSGGTGSNYVAGGLDADTYVASAGVQIERIFDTGGVDRLDLSAYSFDDATFLRFGNTLVIAISGGAGGYFEVVDQWLASSKVEKFTFAEGTYAAFLVQQQAMMDDGPGGTGDEYFSSALPVVLDLDGDGIELIDVSRSHARFDIDGDGIWERIGWVGADDGILALDRNGNGRIDDFSEISFVQDFLGAGSDLEGLYAYDSDGDGFLTAADERFTDFLIWQDKNGNGRSEQHELFTLGELGIVSIGLERSNLNELDPNATSNQILATSVFETADGGSHLVGDVALFVQITTGGWHSPETVSIMPNAQDLPA